MSYKDIHQYCTPQRRPTVPALIQCVEQTITNMRDHDITFICHAVPEGSVGSYLKEFINSQLGRHITLGSWRAANGRDYTTKANRKARFAWLRWMLKNLNEELADQRTSP